MNEKQQERIYLTWLYTIFFLNIPYITLHEKSIFVQSIRTGQGPRFHPPLSALQAAAPQLSSALQTAGSWSERKSADLSSLPPVVIVVAGGSSAMVV